MRKFIYTFLLFPTILFSQIEVVEKDETEGVLIGQTFLMSGLQANGTASLYRYDFLEAEDGKSQYALFFQNQDYEYTTDIRYINFSANQDELESLFEIIKSVAKTGEEVELNIGDNFRLTIQKFMKNEVFIYSYKGSDKNGYFTLNGRGIYLLFGKEFSNKEWRKFLKN